jgi:hypothetical protein
MMGCGRQSDQYTALAEIVVDGDGFFGGDYETMRCATKQGADILETARSADENAFADAVFDAVGG